VEGLSLEIARQGCHFYQLLVFNFSKIFNQGTSLEMSQDLFRLDQSFLVERNEQEPKLYPRHNMASWL